MRNGIWIFLAALLILSACKKTPPPPPGIILKVAMCAEFNDKLITGMSLIVDKSPSMNVGLRLKEHATELGSWGDVVYSASVKDEDGDSEPEWVTEVQGNPFIERVFTVLLDAPAHESAPFSLRIKLSGRSGILGQAEKAYDDNGQLLRFRPGQSQATTITVSCIDGVSCMSASNRPPKLILSNRNPVVAVGTSLSYSVMAVDPDGDKVTLKSDLRNLPAGHGASFDERAGVLAWSPQAGMEGGPYEVTFRAVDDSAALDEESIAITVLPSGSNTPPVFTPMSDQTSAEGMTISFAVSAADPEGEAVILSADLAGLPAGNNASLNEATRLFSWTPGFRHARTLPYVVKFTAADAQGASADQSVMITVLNSNRAPLFESMDQKSVKVGATLSFDVQASDPDGDQVNYEADLSRLPANHGALFAPVTRTLSWTPTVAMEGGPYTLRFIARDTQGAESLLDVSVKVVGPGGNSTPVFMSVGAKNAYEGESISFQVQAWDPDPEDRTLNYSADLAALPANHGAQFDSQSRTFSWTPPQGSARSEPYLVTFSAKDSWMAEGTLTVRLTVNRNQSPVFTAASLADRLVDEGHLLGFTVAATDADGDTINLGADLTGLPAGHDASFNELTGVFTWRPGHRSSGIYQLPLTATDSRGGAHLGDDPYHRRRCGPEASTGRGDAHYHERGRDAGESDFLHRSRRRHCAIDSENASLLGPARWREVDLESRLRHRHSPGGQQAF